MLNSLLCFFSFEVSSSPADVFSFPETLLFLTSPLCSDILAWLSSCCSAAENIIMLNRILNNSSFLLSVSGVYFRNCIRVPLMCSSSEDSSSSVDVRCSKWLILARASDSCCFKADSGCSFDACVMMSSSSCSEVLPYEVGVKI